MFAQGRFPGTEFGTPVLNSMSKDNMNETHVVTVTWPTTCCYIAIHSSSPVASWDSNVPIKNALQHLVWSGHLGTFQLQFFKYYKNQTDYTFAHYIVWKYTYLDAAITFTAFRFTNKWLINEFFLNRSNWFNLDSKLITGLNQFNDWIHLSVIPDLLQDLLNHLLKSTKRIIMWNG